MTRGICVAAVVLVFFHDSAFAYVDPGTGMLVWQGLIAAVGAVIAFVRRPVQTLKAVFRRLLRK